MKMQKTNLMTGLMLIALLACGAFAQSDPERSLDCNDQWNDRDERRSHCEMRENTLAASGKAISVDGRANGGIKVKGWNRSEILVRAKVQAWAPTEEEAHGITSQIQIKTAGANIHAEGPSGSSKRNWSVSYEIFVPHQSDLSLKAHNGGISVRAVRGQIEFETTNGGVSLHETAGRVRGETTNGGLSVVLSGNQWDGEGMDVQTTNGGVNLVVPENYSAHLETGTVNGGIHLDFPVTVQGKIEKEMSFDLGSGGAKLRVKTTNGGISIKRRN